MDLLDKMVTYVRVIEAGSFSSAAKQLRISPGAVSRQIATLEGELGLPLVLRSTRRMTITAEGRRYYECACASCATSTTRRASDAVTRWTACCR